MVIYIRYRVHIVGHPQICGKSHHKVKLFLDLCVKWKNVISIIECDKTLGLKENYTSVHLLITKYIFIPFHVLHVLQILQISKISGMPRSKSQSRQKNSVSKDKAN